MENNIQLNAIITQETKQINASFNNNDTLNAGTTERGPTGNGIINTELISSVGLVDTYGINYTNGNQDTFTVTNGKDGTGSVADVLVNGTSVLDGDVAKVIVPTNNNQLINGAGYITGITSSDVTTALGYTPYDSSNPSGYTSNIGTVTSVNNIQPINGDVTLTIPDTSNLANKDLSNLSSTGDNKFQEPLVSGTNIKTINNNSILGSGDLNLDGLLTETYHNGASWYRIYSDGWCVQGGHMTSLSDTDITVTLLKPYLNTNYNVQLTISTTGAPYTSGSAGPAYFSAYYKTASNFKTRGWTNATLGDKDWIACGYIV